MKKRETVLGFGGIPFSSDRGMPLGALEGFNEMVSLSRACRRASHSNYCSDPFSEGPANLACFFILE